MKKLVFIVLLTCLTTSYAQVTVGPLFKKKDRPAIAISEPNIRSGNITVNERSITIIGDIEDPANASEIRINGSMATLLDNGQFFSTIELQPGENKISVQVINKAGKESAVHFVITSKSVTSGPQITLLEPQRKRGIKIIKSKDYIAVKGLVKDSSGIEEVSVNGTPATLFDSGNFETDIYLAAGDNIIVIRAKNKAGEIAEESFAIQRVASSTVISEKRVALIIGNSEYLRKPLLNPANDAKAMYSALKQMGFDATLKVNIKDQSGMKRAIRDFGSKIREGAIGLFYYSGHGIQIKGKNYLIPVKAQINKEEDVQFEATDVELLLAEMASAANKLNIVILDACRNNPFARSFRSSTGDGLAQISNAPAGTLIAYSTSPGAVASDGTGRNGLYTAQLLKAMNTPGMKLEDVFKQVRKDVRQISNNEQIPWESSSVEGDFFFIK